MPLLTPPFIRRAQREEEMPAPQAREPPQPSLLSPPVHASPSLTSSLRTKPWRVSTPRARDPHQSPWAPEHAHLGRLSDPAASQTRSTASEEQRAAAGGGEAAPNIRASCFRGGFWFPQQESTAAPPSTSGAVFPFPFILLRAAGRGPDLGTGTTQGAGQAWLPPRLTDETQASQLRCPLAPSPGTMPSAQPCVSAAASEPSPRKMPRLQTLSENRLPGE